MGQGGILVVPRGWLGAWHVVGAWGVLGEQVNVWLTEWVVNGLGAAEKDSERGKRDSG